MAGIENIPFVTDLSTGKTYLLNSLKIEHDPMGFVLPEVKLSFMREDGVIFDVSFRRYRRDPKFEITYSNGIKDFI